MLDTETKRRIDSCRDILVGKVPDPKSQVEQITIALIYKFMDDMDAESEELNGKRTFFAKEFARYGWAQLMAPGMGGQDVLNLYSEAIARMNENPGVPTLFRDIFKNAYLPYRDPETLRAFLKEINAFSYDHSERLGDAFEYLLSVLGAQGDAGQFRTPRHLIDFLVEVIDPQKNETVLDPACGTAGFLISAYKHILQANTDKRPGDKLTPDERARLVRNFQGYDISPDMVRLSLANLYLHGFPEPRIEEYDTLTSETHWNDTFDVILANPPFMSPKGGGAIRPHKRFSVPSNRSEVLFVDYIADHISPQGRAAIIVPEGIIFQNGAAYRALRKELVSKSLVAVVSLPAGVFQPYSGVKTSVLILDKRLATHADEILFVKIANDGFGLGAQRREVNGSELPVATAQLRTWFHHLRKLSIGTTITDLDGLHLVSKSRIGENGEWNLSGGRYTDGATTSSDYPMVKLGDICIIERGASPRPIQDFMTDEPDGVNWIKIGDAPVGDKYIYSTKEKVSPAGAAKSRRVKPGDFILSNSMSFGRPYIMATDGCIHDGWLLLRDQSENLDKDYLYSILGSGPVIEQFKQAATGGVVNNLNSKLVREVEIPLPPLAVQQEIAAEIAGYQRVIDGARQVLAAYKPRIAVRPEWPVVELGEMCSLITKGTTPTTNGHKYQESGISFVKIESIQDDGSISKNKLAYIEQKCHDEQRRSQLQAGDILFSIAGTKMGITALVDETILPANTNQALAIIRVKDGLDSRFVFHYLKSVKVQEEIERIKVGVAQFNLSLKQVNEIQIPVPDMDTQLALVVEIETEQRLVDANRDLIDFIEARIQAAIGRVWGAAVREAEVVQ